MTTTSPSNLREDGISAAEWLAIQQLLVRLHYGPHDVEALAKQIARIRIDAYTTRLQEIGQALGIEPGALEPVIEEQIASESAKVAAGIVQTHNTDFGRAASKMTTGDELKQWEIDRADWKSRQIAFNEYQTARNQADKDFRQNNDLQIGGHVVPEDAAEEICQDLVDAGHMTAEELADVDLPAHVNCQHWIELDDDMADAVGDRTDIWLGSMVSIGD